MAWHMDLCLNWDKTVMIPFHHFVKPKPGPQTPRPFRFFDLPVDLQLLVYDHCDAPTLFHLMRTCSRARGPANRRFWSCADHWYSYDSSTWDDGHVVLTHNLEFASLVKRVELGIDRLEWQFCGNGETSIVAKAQDFWAKVGKVFPALENLVLCGYSLQEPTMYSAIGKAVQCAPSHITVFVALEIDYRRWFPTQFTLYSVPEDLDATWEVVDELWTPTRVLLPPRKFPVSPLGDLLTVHQRSLTLLLETLGLNWLRIESYARYAVDGNIHCPRMDCDAVFANREEWKEHLKDVSSGWHGRFETRWGWNRGPMEELLPYIHTPEAERAAMEERQRRIHQGYQETAKLERRVGYGFGPPGSEQRRLFEEQFIAQLKEENLWAPGTITGDLNNGLYELLHINFSRGGTAYGHDGCDGPDSQHICYDPT